MSAPVMTAEELAAIEALAKAATPGLWVDGYRAHAAGVYYALVLGGGDARRVALAIGANDAAFIAHAREDIPRLLAALAHMTKIAEAERALRVAFVDASEVVMRGRITAEEAEGIVAAISPAAANLRALGVEP